MPEYTVTVSKSFTITARNKDIALERAEEIEEIADKLLLDYSSFEIEED